jgi:hypothetical protein
VVDDRRTYGLVWVALRWAAAALQQTDRVLADFEPVKAFMSSPDGRFRRVTPESQRAEALFWADVHFLMISVTHLDRALEMVGTGPALSRAMTANAGRLRHLLEHWEKAEDGGGAWKGLRELHGGFATPTRVVFSLDDLQVGDDSLSIAELAEEVRRVERELAALELELG